MDPFAKYERTPKEIEEDQPELKAIIDWDVQIEKRTAEELQKLNLNK